MRWCWHKWSDWVVTRRSRDADFGTPIVYQEATCSKCGKVKLRART